MSKLILSKDMSIDEKIFTVSSKFTEAQFLKLNELSKKTQIKKSSLIRIMIQYALDNVEVKTGRKQK